MALKKLKLKQKTQPLGAVFLKFEKLKKKFIFKAKCPGYAIFITKYFEKREDFGNGIGFPKKIKKNNNF